MPGAILLSWCRSLNARIKSIFENQLKASQCALLLCALQEEEDVYFRLAEAVSVATQTRFTLPNPNPVSPVDTTQK
jgi:hypothetical protein